MTRKIDLRMWLARLLIGVVVIWNLECATIFLLDPAVYAPGFELGGISGEVAIRGFAILFVMWNIPYLAASWNPRRNRVSLWEALTMQIVGVVGESLILSSVPAGHMTLHDSIVRFIIFDAAGVLCLLAAIFITGRAAARRDDLSA